MKKLLTVITHFFINGTADEHNINCDIDKVEDCSFRRNTGIQYKLQILSE